MRWCCGPARRWISSRWTRRSRGCAPPCWNKGYGDVRIDTTVPRPDASNVVPVKIDVDPGWITRVGRVEFDGNRVMSDATLRRGVLLRPGTLYTRDAVLESQRRLFQSPGIARAVVVTPAAGDSVKTITVAVSEVAPRHVEATVGFNTIEFAQAAVELRHNALGAGRWLRLRAATGNLLSEQLNGWGIFQRAIPERRELRRRRVRAADVSGVADAHAAVDRRRAHVGGALCVRRPTLARRRGGGRECGRVGGNRARARAQDSARAELPVRDDARRGGGGVLLLGLRHLRRTDPRRAGPHAAALADRRERLDRPLGRSRQPDARLHGRRSIWSTRRRPRARRSRTSARRRTSRTTSRSGRSRRTTP